jgi:hypothetical protein
VGLGQDGRRGGCAHAVPGAGEGGADILAVAVTSGACVPGACVRVFMFSVSASASVCVLSCIYMPVCTGAGPMSPLLGRSCTAACVLCLGIVVPELGCVFYW